MGEIPKKEARTKMKIKLYFLLIFALPSYVSAYEVHTHARMSEQAYARVMQEDNQLINRLGLTLTKDYLGNKYYDVSGASIYQRTAKDFSLNRNRMPEGVISLSSFLQGVTTDV